MPMRLLSCAIALGAALVVFPDAARADATLEVRNLEVAFLPEGRLRVRGELRCKGLVPGDTWHYQHPDSTVEVNVDFPHGKRGFSLLPEHFFGLGIDDEERAEDRRIGHYPMFRHRGTYYRVGTKKVTFYSSTLILRPPVLDKRLDDAKDEARWIAFDKTLDFGHVQAQRPRYRVVVGWKLDYIRTGAWFSHRYHWAVYGPFDWGEAPACRHVLRSTELSPASFTRKGVAQVKPVKDFQDPASKKPAGESDDGEAKRPKLEAASKRPTQLLAVNAAAALEEKLAGWPEVKAAAARANPRLGRVEVRGVPKLEPLALTKLVARVALEAAYAFNWVGTLDLEVRGEHGTTTVQVAWEQARRHAHHDATLREFFETWKVQGAALAKPPLPRKP